MKLLESTDSAASILQIASRSDRLVRRSRNRFSLQFEFGLSLCVKRDSGLLLDILLDITLERVSLTTIPVAS